MWMKRVSVVAAAVLAIFTVATTASAQAPVNGVQATTVPLSLPGGLAYDSAGNLYIAATNDHVIRKVDLNGIITTVAGTGTQGFAGDGGAATSALLDSPAGVALDSSGNIYIADTHNNRIREVLASTGVISTIAGTGVNGFSGDGAAATAATLSYPTAVAVDTAGNVYIADTNNHRIRKIIGTTISTVAGNGDQAYEGDNVLATTTGLDTPNGVAVDASFNIYIGDTHNQRVRLVTAATGFITTFAGTGVKTYTADGGAATGAALARPRGVAVSPNGTILIADSDNDRVRTVTGGTINTAVGNGTQGFAGDTGLATAATIDTPRAVAATAGNNVVVSDTSNQRVREVDGNGDLITIAGLGATGTESLVLSTTASTVVYGTGSLTATFSFGSNTATGNVTFYDVTGAGPVAVGLPVALSSNKATFSTSTLSVGKHFIEAVYPGDPNNATAASGQYEITVTPLAITATATPISVAFGAPIPTLTGTLTGVLAQDSGNVTAVFSTTAAQGSPVGVYPITVTLTAAANVTITQAASATVLTTSNATPYRGTTVQLVATVSSLTTGTPTGIVNFYNGTPSPATLLGNGVVAAGVATFVTTALPLGVSTVCAVYLGETNFTTSNSNCLTETVTDADFAITVNRTGPSSTTQTIVPGGSVSYSFTVTPTLATFPLPVTFTVTGLPAGATYTLTPSSLAAGSGTTSLTLFVQTLKTHAELEQHKDRWMGFAVPLLLLPFAGFKRTREVVAGKRSRGRMLMLVLLLAGMMGTLAGCGAGGFFGTSQQSYNIVVTATSGTISHSQSVTLIVQ